MTPDQREKLRQRLVTACQEGDFDTARDVIDQAGSVSLAMRVDKWAVTPLHEACEYGRTDIVKLFLDRGLKKVDLFDSELATPLFRACTRGHAATAKLLLDHGASVNGKDDNGQTSLHMASLYGHDDVVELLLSRGADVNILDLHNRMAPLHYVRTRQTVLLLVKAGADVNLGDDQKPLHHVVTWRCTGLFTCLVENGADVELTDRNGKTPLDYAVELSTMYPRREEILNWYRENRPELVMEKFCTANRPAGPGAG